MKLVFKQYKYIKSYACIVITNDQIKKPVYNKIQSGIRNST